MSTIGNRLLHCRPASAILRQAAGRQLFRYHSPAVGSAGEYLRKEMTKLLVDATPDEMAFGGLDSAVAGEPAVRGIFPLNPAESKRLIAKGVAAMPAVRRARESGRLIIGWGTTNAYVAEELLGFRVPKFGYCSGVITKGKLANIPDKQKVRPYCLRNGQIIDIHFREMMAEMGADDVIIKGANAVDREGHAGILLAAGDSGTIGAAMQVVCGRGVQLVVPVGLEKMVPSVIAASRRCGIQRFKYAIGSPCGFIPLVNATVVTELQALQLLTGVKATHVASGGVGGDEGAVTIVIEGTDERVAAAMELIERIKGEEAVRQESEIESQPMQWVGR